MKPRWAALGLVLALGVFMPDRLDAQSAPPTAPEQQGQVEFGPNYPNPFNLDTRIPFALGAPPQCQEQGRLYRVTMRIYNLLSQLVAVPVLEGGAGGGSGGQPLENVQLPCDRYTAYWDGKVQSTSQDAGRGIYLYSLEVDGKSYGVKRMFLRR